MYEQHTSDSRVHPADTNAHTVVLGGRFGPRGRGPLGVPSARRDPEQVLRRGMQTLHFERILARITTCERTVCDSSESNLYTVQRVQSSSTSTLLDFGEKNFIKIFLNFTKNFKVTF